MQPRPEQSVSVWPYASDQRPARRVLMVATTAQNSPIYNLDASNAMQIMSFRFAIKMLNRYFCPQTAGRRRGGAGLIRDTHRPICNACHRTTHHQSEPSYGMACLVHKQHNIRAPVITALIYCLRFCDINLFIISEPRPIGKIKTKKSKRLSKKIT